MNCVKITYTGKNYSCLAADTIKISILGHFLTSDVRCMNVNFYKKWGLDNNQDTTGGNITYLEKENGHIYLSDLYSEEKVPTKLIMTIEQFVQLLGDWDIKVCKARPQEVSITYDNDQFTIEIPH